MRGLRTEAKIEQETEAAQGERHALKSAKRTGQLLVDELHEKRDEQHQHDADDRRAIAEADECRHD